MKYARWMTWKRVYDVSADWSTISVKFPFGRNRKFSPDCIIEIFLFKTNNAFIRFLHQSEFPRPVKSTGNMILNIEYMNVTASECIDVRSVLVSIERVNATRMLSCIFENASGGASGETGGRLNGLDVCTWNSGAVLLKNVKNGTIEKCIFNRTVNRGIDVEGGSAEILECAFNQTSRVNASYPSVQHNIACGKEGAVKMSYFNGQLVSDSMSLWISNSDCALSTSESEALPPSLFFLPSLTSVEYHNKSDPQSSAQSALVFWGEQLIPCSLMYQIHYKNGTPYIYTKEALSN